MEEQEKIDIREHLIGWIDNFLEDGIVPQVVNPKAIRANYILKSKIKEKIQELHCEYYQEREKAKKIEELQALTTMYTKICIVLEELILESIYSSESIENEE